MDLNSILVSDFAKITNDEKETNNEGTTVYATYRVQGEEAYVQIDGSDTLTPVATTASAKSGDRVTVLIKNHRAIITGNMTDPSASSETVRTLDLGLGGLNDTIRNVSNSVSDLSGEVDGISTQVTGMAASIEGAEKVATNFLSFEDPYGLIVGDLTGSTLGFNVLIDATSVNMRYNSTVLAKYASDTIYLGYNSRESIIDMCNGLATIGPDADYINRLMIKSASGISLDASSGPIGIMSMRSLLWLQNDGIFLLSNPTQDPGNGNDSSNVGFYLDNSTREIDVYGTIVGYSKTTHTHSGYASSSHTHSRIESSYGGYMPIVYSSGEYYVRPGDTYNTYNCGGNTYRWDVVYTNSVDETSDIRLKENLSKDMDKYVQMLDLLDPISYEWISEADKPDRKRHIGYGAQYVKMAMAEVGLEEKDFGGLNKYMKEDESVYGYSLRYSQFIPILHAKIKQLEARIESLEKKEV